LTEAAVDKDGWFTTGDIGWIAPNHTIGRSRLCGGMLVLEGRAKDTIVLTTGYLKIKRKFKLYP
jgi:long-chain acyl-CoA synthetase